MYYSSKNIVYARDWAALVLEAFNTNPSHAMISSAEIGLWKTQDFTPNPSTPIATIEANECDFSGYARQAVTFSGTLNLGTNLPGIMASPRFTMETASPLVPNSGYGWFLVSALGLVCSEKFPTGTVALFGTPGDFAQIDVACALSLYQATQ